MNFNLDTELAKMFQALRNKRGSKVSNVASEVQDMISLWKSVCIRNGIEASNLPDFTTMRLDSEPTFPDISDLVGWAKGTATSTQKGNTWKPTYGLTAKYDMELKLVDCDLWCSKSGYGEEIEGNGYIVQGFPGAFWTDKGEIRGGTARDMIFASEPQRSQWLAQFNRCPMSGMVIVKRKIEPVDGFTNANQ